MFNQAENSAVVNTNPLTNTITIKVTVVENGYGCLLRRDEVAIDVNEVGHTSSIHISTSVLYAHRCM